MGLTSNSTGLGALNESLTVRKESENERIVALGGNPNVGKSTVFNSLTGLNQHTGNWPGKTVGCAVGRFTHGNSEFVLVDIPGTYSLFAGSEEEAIARDFICFGDPDVTVIVADATNLERNLGLLLQTAEITNKLVLCVNLMDEAERKGISVDVEKLQERLGLPAVATSAGKGKGLERLIEVIDDVASGKEQPRPIKLKYDGRIEEAINPLQRALEEKYGLDDARWHAVKLLENSEPLTGRLKEKYGIDEDKGEIAAAIAASRGMLEDQGFDHRTLEDSIVATVVKTAEEIASEAVKNSKSDANARDRRIDSILTSKKFGIPIMLLLLTFVMWLTISGANYPSQLLSDLLFGFQGTLSGLASDIGLPAWLSGLLIDGVYRTLAWVIAVMLPPMAIFFPLFTLLEDLGYLPRIAFNLDGFFKRSCACGKQALTMCMGFGCNAAGVVGCRIIDSPREKLIAIITNSFVPCNGRFPTLIAVITMFFAGIIAFPWQGIVSAVMLVGLIVLGVCATLLVSRLLSKTLLKGVPSSFALELPPYRKPQVGKILVRSVFDRTLFVLGRAAAVAAPAGAIIWLMANITVGDSSLLTLCAEFLDPAASLIGMDGYILMAFILGFPANEIVVPIIIMSYMSAGSILELESLTELHGLLVSHGWTVHTAICVMLFSLMHWPCSTTCLTIHKETKSIKWTLLSVFIPTAAGTSICFIITMLARLFGAA